MSNHTPFPGCTLRSDRIRFGYRVVVIVSKICFSSGEQEALKFQYECVSSSNSKYQEWNPVDAK